MKRGTPESSLSSSAAASDVNNRQAKIFPKFARKMLMFVICGAIAAPG